MNHFTQEHINVRKHYNTTKQAKHWLEVIQTTSLTPDRIKLIKSTPYFFLATSHKNGQTNVNYKGLEGKSLIHVVNKTRLIFPDYTGNGILHSIGDIISNPNIGMLIINFDQNKRLKINGKATIIEDKEMLLKYSNIFKSDSIVRLIQVDIQYVIENCSSHIGIVNKR